MRFLCNPFEHRYFPSQPHAWLLEAFSSPLTLSARFFDLGFEGVGGDRSLEESFYYPSSLCVLLEGEKRILIAATAVQALGGINIY